MLPQPRRVTAAVLIGLGLAACQIRDQDFERAPSLEPVTLAGPTPPPVDQPEGERLYQLLYAGEVGEVSGAAGQHARMLAWLAVMDFSDAQLDGLLALRADLAALRAEQEAARAALDAREQELLVPLYDRIAAGYARGGALDEEALGTLAGELAKARKLAYRDDDPRAQKLARVEALLEKVEPWIAGLSQTQRHDLPLCRFFLRKKVGPLLNPTDYGDLTGISWDGGDFRGVSTTIRSADEQHMDIGGLWSTEFMRAPPQLYLTDLQLKAVTVMALEEPGLEAAIAARRRGAPVEAAPTGSGE
jgi:hypothetical protein